MHLNGAGLDINAPFGYKQSVMVESLVVGGWKNF